MDFYTPEQDQKRAAGVIEFDPSLPYALIIGDSISIGYTPFVREYLAGRWNVARPRANCGDTIRGLASIDEWLGGRRWDVIHFNWGLHDLCHRHPDSKIYGNRDKINGPVSVPLDQYRQNLQTLVRRMRLAAGRLIWAETTIIPPDEAGRHQGDDAKYNAVARSIMSSEKVEVNDLHTLTAAFGPERFTAPGDVHFTEEGYRILGRQVADAIASVNGRA
jgi:lysophospholipase L1-like esterase